MNQQKSRDKEALKGFLENNNNSDTTESDTIQEMPIDRIITRPNQPRKYFDESKLQDLAKSIKQQGILQPLIIRPTKNQKYELIAGERRLKAAKLARLTTVPVTIKDLTEKEAISISLVENLQREDLNPIEQTEGILLLLSHETDEDPETIVKTLIRAEKEQRGEAAQNVLGGSLANNIIKAFNESHLAITWQSFVKTKLPLRKLPEEITNAIKQGKIEYTKGLEINKIKNQEEREKLLQNAIKKKLSVKDIKNKIKELKEQQQPTNKTEDTLPKRITAIAKKAKKVSDDKKDAVEKLLKQLEELLDK